MTTETTIAYNYEFTDNCGRHVGKKSIPASLATCDDFRLALLASARDWLKWHAGAWTANLPGYDFAALCEAIKDGDDWSDWANQLADEARRTICDDLEDGKSLAGAFGDDWFAILDRDDDAAAAAHYYNLGTDFCFADSALNGTATLTYGDEWEATADLASHMMADPDDIAADIRLAAADAIRNSRAVRRHLDA